MLLFKQETKLPATLCSKKKTLIILLILLLLLLFFFSFYKTLLKIYAQKTLYTLKRDILKRYLLHINFENSLFITHFVS